MIVKKVPVSKAAAAKSKAAHVRDLCDYIAGPDAGDEREKVEHRGSVNLLNIDHDAQVGEMADLAEAARRSPQPVQHWIMSWRQGEQPTPTQADQAVRIFLKEMGLSGHQAIYALHRDTDNWHMHLALNRVHPESERVVTVNGRFDLEVAHRAIARIEHEQGWERERGGRYQVLDTGLVERVESGRSPEREPSTPARDFENLTGQKSAQRTAIDEGARLMRRARAWLELHELLAEHGMRFEKKGSGALLWVGDTAVKASTAGRDCSMSALEKRLGAFVPPPPRAREPRRREPEPIAPNALGWDTYAAGRQRHYAARKQERGLMGKRQKEQWRDMVERHRGERRKVLGGNWRGKGAALNALRSVLAARQAQEKAALRERQQLERSTMRERFPTWPTFEEWLGEHWSREEADRWRFRDRTPAKIVGERDDPALPRDIRSFVGEQHGGEVQYHRIGTHSKGPSFIDRGREIRIHDLDRDSVLAALQLSAQKWGKFEVFGSAEYKRLCAELAAEHGFRIANPEVQKSIAAARDRRQGRHARPRRAPEGPGPPPQAPPGSSRSRTPVSGIGEAYERHFDELARQRGRADLSRVDALVAVRLRVTGCDRVDVEEAIREGAAKRRPHEARDWGEYARRAADHAFGVSGERDLQRMEKVLDRLLEVEGLEQARDPSLDMPPFPGLDRWR